ncbi:MAG TPA: AIPR family protein, partial [Blastocatellia bacterium]|nr:AIPR family protein [Blastocatellia bacterium]
MSELDLRALEANFQGWKQDRAPGLSDGDAFERYAIENVLKDFDLSDDEMKSGRTGGSDDGGVDGVYFFVNRTLVQDETELPDPVTVQLILIQAKYESGFWETAIEKMQSFTRDLLDYTTPVDRLVHLNSFARDVIARFRDRYNEILGTQHTLTVHYYYVTKSDTAPNPKVRYREQILTQSVREKLSAARVEFIYWGCAQLLSTARTAPQFRLNLTYTKYFNTSDQSSVSLVALKSFAEALKDDNGELRRSLLEPNVRAYQGKRNPVNQEIQGTLKMPIAEAPEFWWLNNGVTILADHCAIVGDKLVI